MSTDREWDWMEDGYGKTRQVRCYDKGEYKVWMHDDLAKGLDWIEKKVELELMVPQKQWWEPLKD